MVFVNPSVRIARHRRMAVAMRRRLDALLASAGYRYRSTEIDKTHVSLTYSSGPDEIVFVERDQHAPSGPTYTLEAGGHAVSFAGESELAGALEALTAQLFPVK